MRSRVSTAIATSPEGSARTPGGPRLVSTAELRSAPTMISSRTSSDPTALARTPLSKRAFDALLAGVGLLLWLEEHAHVDRDPRRSPGASRADGGDPSQQHLRPGGVSPPLDDLGRRDRSDLRTGPGRVRARVRCARRSPGRSDVSTQDLESHMKRACERLRAAAPTFSSQRTRKSTRIARRFSSTEEAWTKPNSSG